MTFPPLDVCRDYTRANRACFPPIQTETKNRLGAMLRKPGMPRLLACRKAFFAGIEAAANESRREAAMAHAAYDGIFLAPESIVTFPGFTPFDSDGLPPHDLTEVRAERSGETGQCPNRHAPEE
jgi:hypothetical protein